MKPRSLYRYIRKEPDALVREATWRGIKAVRQWRLRNDRPGVTTAQFAFNLSAIIGARTSLILSRPGKAL